MKSGIKHHPFTMSQGVFPRLIVSHIEVLNPKAAMPQSIAGLTSLAQWDTGADFCMISPSLARNLRLAPGEEVTVNQVEGQGVKHRSYIVNVVLPNGIFFEDVLAIEDPGLKSYGVDFLIGLAIINEVDFALTHNKDGESVLSISYPSDRLIDFAK